MPGTRLRRRGTTLATTSRSVRCVAVVALVAALLLPATLLAAPGQAAAQGGPGWTVTTGIDPSNASDNSLSGVSCQSAVQCLGVGTSYGEENDLPVTDALEGSSTWVAATAALESDNVGLDSVSCVSSSWCMAVGWEIDTNDAYHLIAAVYSGGTWTVNASLERPAYAYPGSAKLESVSCTSETSCVAVGETDPYAYSYYESPLVLTFDGRGWSPVSISYDASFSGGALSSVSCADATDCAAVGQFYNDDVGNEESFAVELSPSGWTLLDDLDNTSQEASSELDGVSCPAAGQCEAVGEYTDTYYGYEWALAGSLDGTSWTPDYYDATPGTLYDEGAQLSSVSCTAPTSCVAAGSGEGDGIVDVFSNGTWTDSVVSVQGSDDTDLLGVSCSSDFACEAVGDYDNNGYNSIVAVSGSIPPSISGPTAATFTQGTLGSVTVTATGASPVTLSEDGTLPPNVTFDDANSGTGTDSAVLSGTPGPFTGTYDFSITATDGNGNQTSEEFQLTVLPLGPNPPVVNLLTPDVSSAAGGGKVTISGHYLTGAIAVLFNGMPATSFRVVNSTTISAVPPAYSGPLTNLPSIVRAHSEFPQYAFTGTIGNVEVVTPEGATSPSADTVWQYVAPDPSYISPSSVYGGETVTIYGSFLGGATAVWFQGVESPKFKVLAGGTSIQAVVPYNIAGYAYVEVDSAAGEGYADNGVVLKGPVVTSVTPRKAAYDAGSTITINGADFYDVYQVNFGDYSTDDFTVNANGTQITVVEPQGPTGTVNVGVLGDYGTSSPSAGSLLVNLGPQITAVLPNTAATGSLITVIGTGLAHADTVYFGSTPASFWYNTDTSITVQVPPGLGTQIVNIRLLDPAGESPITKADEYEN